MKFTETLDKGSWMAGCRLLDVLDFVWCSIWPQACISKYLIVISTEIISKHSTNVSAHFWCFASSFLVIFINDLSDHVLVDDYSTCHLYADDAAITINATNNEELEARLQHKLDCTAQWMEQNLLTINTTKTKIMFFGTTHTLSSIIPPEIRSGDETIEIVDRFK